MKQNDQPTIHVRKMKLKKEKEKNDAKRRIQRKLN